MPFKWKKLRPLRQPRPDRVEGKAPDPELTGFVHGQSATDIEERMYKAFLNNDVGDAEIEYQPSFVAGRNLPGEIRPDYVIDRGGLLQMYFADGEYWHRTAQQKRADEANDAILFARMGGIAEFPIRVPGEDLATQEQADRNIGLALRGVYEPTRRQGT